MANRVVWLHGAATLGVAGFVWTAWVAGLPSAAGPLALALSSAARGSAEAEALRVACAAMLAAEAATALHLVLFPPRRISMQAAAWAGLALLVLIWLMVATLTTAPFVVATASDGGVSVLRCGLIACTAAWAARAALATWMLSAAIERG